MPRHSFVIGDRVRTTNPYTNTDYQPPQGAEGTVVELDGQYLLRIDFGTAWQDSLGRSICQLSYEHLEAAPIRPFYLVAIQDGKEVMLKDHPTFDTGRQASAYAVDLMRKMGCKIQPRRLTVETSDWRQREQARIDSGEYTPLPATWDLPPIADHFLHLSKRDNTMLAFTESPEKGAMDRQTPISPGKYLNRFYSHLKQEDLKRYIAMIDKLPELKIARTGDEIEHVYAYGPDSCMAGPMHYEFDDDGEPDDEDYGIRDDQDPFEGFCHPVRVYGDSDLAVAYLQRGAKVTARSVIWPDRKIWVRTYGDCARLERALEAEGYQRGSLQGARIKRLWDKREHAFVMPYLDDVQAVRDLGEESGFMMIDSEGTISADSTGGLTERMQRCERTNKYYDHGATFVEVVTAPTPFRQSQTWIYEQARNHAVQFSEPVNGWPYERTTWYAKELCTKLGDPDRSTAMMPTHRLEELCFQSAGNGFWYKNDDGVEISDGRMVSVWEYDECRACTGNGKVYLPTEGQFVEHRWFSNECLKKKDERNARRREQRRAQREDQAAAAA